jgi:uncharacterized glyoxalase superfamily protein PhnB
VDYAGVIPYLAVANAREALDWYVTALGATRRGEPVVVPDGRVGHVELELNGSILMLADEFPDIGHVAPKPGAGSSVTLHVSAPDVDIATNRAVSAGAKLDRPPQDSPHGRNAAIVDPFGHRWLFTTEP